MSLAFRIVLAAIVVTAMIFAARLLDRRWRANNPEEKPFAWGYFQALFFFPAGLLWFAMPFIGDRTSWALWLSIIVYGVVGSFAGFTLIRKKKRWAWIFVVVAQPNLITWLIDIRYGGNRWREFR